MTLSDVDDLTVKGLGPSDIDSTGTLNGSLQSRLNQNISDIHGQVQGEWTEEEEKAVRRKLDFRIVPVITALYLFCFLDRSNIGNARIQGMAKDLKLVGHQFNWALTVFYIPYLMVEIPSNVLLKRIGPRLWIPFLVFAFGFISMMTSFVKNFSQLCAARAVLGFFEGGTMPGIAFFLSCFYKRHELLLRVGLFVSSSSMAGAFGGLFATALARIPEWGIKGAKINTWRNIFFFEGVMTMLIALMGYLLLPSSPCTATFLNPREQFIAYQRMKREHHDSANHKITAKHVARAIANWNNTVCALGFFLLNITVQSFSLFLPTILNDLGWAATKAQLYSVPPYVVACIWSIFVAYLSDRTRLRGAYLMLGCVLCIIGYSILITSPPPSIAYLAVFFGAMGAFPGGPGFLSWGLNNAAGDSVRAVSSAYIVSVGTAGAIVATWTYLPEDSPYYKTGHSINLGAQVGVGVLAMLGVFYVRWENRMREKGVRDGRVEGKNEEVVRDLGYRHPSFRYTP
ncbi:major facilitator superfamily domain-containing protein [Tirmania nivea]|nr:major facilitator superfamily domain-containing protein [Tirmania nivea]